MEGVVRADLHALAAADAALEEVHLVQCARRTNEARIRVDLQARGRPQEGDQDGARGHARDQLSALHFRRFTDRRVAGRRADGEADTVSGAVANAVEAQVALRLAPRGPRNRIVAALAVQQAAAAVVARGRVLFQVNERPARGNSEQAAERAQGAAPEARHAQVEREQEGEDQADEHGLAKVRLLERGQGALQDELQRLRHEAHGRDVARVKAVDQAANRVVGGRQVRESQGADGERNRIDQAGEQRPEEGRQQDGREDVVLDRLPRLVAVGFQERLAALLLGLEAAEEVVERPERADPAAEEPAEEERRDHDHQAPQQAAVERAGGDGRREGGQRVRLEEDRHRPRQSHLAAGAPERAGELRPEQQEQERRKEQDLRRAANGGEAGMVHRSTKPGIDD